MNRSESEKGRTGTKDQFDWEEVRYAGAGGLSMEELAAEWSAMGMEILECLGKKGISLTTVVAGWLRGCWLKYAGLVTESVGLPYLLGMMNLG